MLSETFLNYTRVLGGEVEVKFKLAGLTRIVLFQVTSLCLGKTVRFQVCIIEKFSMHNHIIVRKL